MENEYDNLEQWVIQVSNSEDGGEFCYYDQELENGFGEFYRRRLIDYAKVNVWAVSSCNFGRRGK